MGKELADTFPVARHLFEEADEALGFKLSDLCFTGSDADLKLTANTQPAILTASIAVLKVVRQETGLNADYVAGHSLGEYSALVCSGAISFADAVRTVRARGTFMQEAVPVGTGTMAAMLGIERDVLEERVRRIEQGADHVVVGIGEARVREAHAAGQQAEDLDVALSFAGRCERGPRQLEVIVPVGGVQVGVLQEGGHREHDIGMIGGVRLELLQHDGEQIFAAQTAQHEVLVGRDRGWIGVIDHQRLHRRRHMDRACNEHCPLPGKSR